MIHNPIDQAGRQTPELGDLSRIGIEIVTCDGEGRPASSSILSLVHYLAPLAPVSRARRAAR